MAATRTKGRRCDRKIRHGTRRSANEHRDRLIRAGTAEDRIEVYPCNHCGGFHVGHGPRGKR